MHMPRARLHRTPQALDPSIYYDTFPSSTSYPSSITGKVAPNNGVLTVEKCAINAVMAGCAPKHFAVVVSACECMVDEKFNLHGISSTTMGVSNSSSASFFFAFFGGFSLEAAFCSGTWADVRRSDDS